MTNAQVLECFMGDYYIVRVSGELELSPGDWLEIRHDKPPEQKLFAAEDLLPELYLLAEKAAGSVAEAHAALEHALGMDGRDKHDDLPSSPPRR